MLEKDSSGVNDQIKKGNKKGFDEENLDLE